MVQHKTFLQPAKLLFDPPHQKSKIQSCSIIGMWGVYLKVLRANAQNSTCFPTCFSNFLEKFQKLLKNHDFENIHAEDEVYQAKVTISFFEPRAK